MKCVTALQNNTLALNVYVQPRASKQRLAGMHGDALKICITAPPVENKGNEAIISFIANLFRVPKGAVTIKSGRQGRRKKVLIAGLSPGEAREVLGRALSVNAKGE